METVKKEEFLFKFFSKDVTAHRIADENFYPGLGWELDLDETTCSPEVLAYLNATEDERKLPTEVWKEMYASGKTNGQLHPESEELELLFV